MSDRTDLTRWIRAGLTRFRYIDGNAVEYLEILRQQLVRHFVDSNTTESSWLKPAEEIPENEEELNNETLIQRRERLGRKQERILEMYHQDRRDWGWEISRTFARACHILTEHSNAYANEEYLGTATQWEHVRRLVEMLDYHPAPPASAYTRLSFESKENKSGIVPKGFKVQHSPETGGPKIIFETLEDIFIDSALNELRPKGWDKSDVPDASLPGGSSSSSEKLMFSNIAEGEVINLQGVGDTWSIQLNTLTHPESFKIKDFLDLDPENPGIILDPEDDGYKFEPNVDPGAEIGVIRLRELRAKASAICNFELEEGWSDITNWLLTRIASELPESLAEQTGKSLTEVKALQLEIDLIGAYLDHDVYKRAKLKDLIAPSGSKKKDAGIPQSVPTAWRVEKKPKVVEGQVAMIFHESNNKAEAATVNKVSESEGKIDLLLDQVDYSWTKWIKSEVALYVSPRWKRKCWLNGDNVIRTIEPHGLRKGAYICWNANDVPEKTSNIDDWRYAKVIEADKRNLRLEVNGPLPHEGAKIIVAIPFDELEDGSIVPADMKEYGVVSGEALEAIDPEFLDVASDSTAESLFKLAEPNTGVDGNAPPMMPPGALDFGSFLFPSPMLPIDLVKAAVKLLLSMGIMVIPSTGIHVFKFMSPAEVDSAAADIVAKVDQALLDLEGFEWKVDDPLNDIIAILAPPEEQSLPLFKTISEALAKQLDDLDSPLLGIPQQPNVKAIVEASEPLYMFDGKPEELVNNEWVVGRFDDGLRGLKIRSITEFSDDDKTESFSVSFSNLVGNEGELQKVYADFRGPLIAEGASVNETQIVSEEIELEDVPDSLKVGDNVFLTAENKEPIAATIASIDGNTISTNPSAEGFTKGELQILANVVLAGHGESKPAKILGSGDAAKSNQEFTLEVDHVSFPPDTTMSSGVAAAIEVEVAGRVWEQVSSLKDSTSGDHHYAIRMSEEGSVKVLFGDGEYGRRLPTGKNNIRVRYRVGNGLAGNVAAGGLEKPVNPHPLIKTIKQPLGAEGGGDMEDVTSLRENAPPTLLALERAVSLSDFAHLAASQSSVWQAKAYSQILHGGRTESVNVVIVPADGVQSVESLKTIRLLLQKHALPGVLVTVEDFSEYKKIFSIAAKVRVKTDEFVPEEVVKAVASALTVHFTLKNRKLGEHLYLSDAYKIVEWVKGVENSICEILEQPSESDVSKRKKALQIIRAENVKTVIYLDTDAGSTLEVSHEEYQP